MVDKDKREGKIIYEEDKIEVRDCPLDSNAHNLWIRDDYFLLQRGVLEEFVERVPLERLEKHLENYDYRLPFVLKAEQVSIERLVIILARARIKESETRIGYLERELYSAHEILAAQHDCD